MITNLLFQKNSVFTQHIIKTLLVCALLCGMHNHASAATLVRPPNNLGLVGYWPMDEGTGLIVNDMSGNRLTGTTTVALAPTWTTGKRGKALSFDGVSQRILLGVGTVGQKIHGATSVTMSAWINPTAYPSIGRTRVFTVTQNSTTGAYIGLNSATGNLEVGGRSSTGDTFQNVVSSVIPQNKWTHVVGILNFSTDIITLYIDGVFISNNPASFVSNTYVHTLGGPQTDNIGMGDNSDYFTGKIDDVRVYNRQLNAAQVAALYQSGQTTRKQVSNQGLVGYWSLNEGSGTIANDSSGNGNKGTLSGPTWTTGKYGSGLTFTNGSRVTVGTLGSFGSQAYNGYTITGWFRSTNTADYDCIFDSISGAQTRILLCLQTGSTQIQSAFQGPSGTFRSQTATVSNFRDGKWHFVATVVNPLSQTVKIHFDDTINTYTSVGDTTPFTNFVATASISKASPSADAFTGDLDDIRIYNRELSATEIANLYKQNETRINSSQNSELTNGLVGLWSFNGVDYNNASTTAEVLDRSGQGNNGDAINGPVPTIGKVGQGLNLDGVDDYVTAADHPSLDFGTASFSVSAWINSTATTQQRIVNKWQTPGWTFDINSGTAGTFRFRMVSGGDVDYAVAAGITTNKWQFVSAVVNRSTNLVTLYVDGTQVGTPQDISTIGSVNSTASLGIGVIPGTPGLYFKGVMDEVRIYNRALSAAEVKLLYNLGK